VGVGLAAAAQQIAALKQTVQQQQTAINQLTAKIDALLTPTIVEATAGDAGAEVRWALASTTVTAAPGGATCTTNGLGGERACKISGLTNGINYTFTARLTNGAGAGSTSPPSNPVTPGPQCRLLTLSAEGSGMLTAMPPKSTGCPASSFTPGASILLAASPAAGFTLASWGGSLPGPSELQWQWQYTMPGAAAAQKATFAQCHALSVGLVGDGSAISERVPSASAGCPAGFHIAGDTVVLSLTAYNSAFVSWQAPVSSSENPLVYHMPAGDATLVAQVLQCYPLTATSNGGTLTRSPSKSGDCAEGHYFSGAAVTISFTPPVGYDFLGWTGGANGTANPLSFVMPSSPASLPLRARLRNRLHSTTASFVLGQPSLNERQALNPASVPWALAGPVAVAIDAADNVLVADIYAHRILVFAPDTTTPFRVIGQADFNGTGPNRGMGTTTAAADTLSAPAGLTFDAEGGLFVADSDNARVLYFPAGADNATRVYGQNGDFTSNTARSGADGLFTPSHVALARDGSGLFITDLNNHRVLFFAGTSTTATRVIGQPDFDTTTSGDGPNKLLVPGTVAVDELGGLWVADQGNRRLVYFPAGSSVATRVLGQPDLFTVAPSSVTASSFRGVFGVALDLAGGLYVNDRENSRVLYFEADATAASYVWGQLGNFTTNAINLVGTNYDAATVNPTADSLGVSLFPPVVDSQHRMYIADTWNMRVVRYESL